MKPLVTQDFQIQSIYSDGKNSIDEMVDASVAVGRKVIGITDHANGWHAEGKYHDFFPTAQSFQSYLAEITAAQKRYQKDGIVILAGLEVEVMLDGRLSLSRGILEAIGSEDRLLAHVDYLIGVIHSESFGEDIEGMGPVGGAMKSKLLLQNIAHLINNPDILIWGHPFQATHGHLRRHFSDFERQVVLKLLGARSKRMRPLILEYNLNPHPHYDEWNGQYDLYTSDRLTPNDLTFFDKYVKQDGIVSLGTDAHKIEDINRLSPETRLPESIVSNLHLR